MKVKCGLEKDLKVLENIELGKDKEKRIKTEEIKLENVMMKCLELQVENAKEKEELLKEIYMIRYYFFLNLSKDNIILKESKLQKSVKTLKKTILKKAIDDKLIIKIVKDDEINFDILSYIFENRIINLENLVIELEVKDKLIVRYYDGDILDKELTFEEIDKSNLLIKKNKKTKIFLLK